MELRVLFAMWSVAVTSLASCLLLTLVFIDGPLGTSGGFLDGIVRFHKDRDAIWVKAITRRTDKATLTCPLGHVIYGPLFLVGARAQNDSTLIVSGSDCRGFAQDTLTQTKKCFWQQSCKLRWRERMPIVTSSNRNCVGRLPDYVIFNNPLCIPSDYVITMCDGDDVIDADYGILRSHKRYPWNPNRGNISVACRKTLVPKPYHTLTLFIEDFAISHTDNMMIYHVTASGPRMLRGNVNQNDVLFSVTSGRVIVDFIIGARRASSTASGFVIRFEQKTCKYQHNDLAVGRMAQTVASFGVSHFKVRAAINRCLSNNKETMTLACPDGHVIFQPEVRQGVSGWERRCHGETGNCRGLSHTLLVQQNQCHWRPQCRLSWRNKVPILVSEQQHCLARSPDYVEMQGAQCVPKESVFDICDRTYWSLNVTRGLLRSHSDFPWNYGHQPQVCRKRICVHRKFGLRIVSDNLDLSHSARGDHLKVWCVGEDNERTLVRVYRRNESVEECFTSGCVDLEFKKMANQNRGRGFVLRLDSVLPVTDDSRDFYRCGLLTDAVRKQREERIKRKRERLAAASKWTCEDDGLTFRTTARDLQKRVKLDCKNGRLIAGLTFVGHNGTCQGLTPDLFVQMSSCFWKSNCMFKYDVSSTNYMLKLFRGKASDCILKQPDTFTFSYNCTVKKTVTVLDIGGTDSQTSKAKGGVIRSHEDHPWLYRRSHAHDMLTLKRPSPSKKHKHFAFTIHTLSLVEGDNLTVTAKTGDKTSETKLFTASDKVQLTDAAKDNTYILAKATEVIFSLDASQFTNGGEGFVICFGWVKSKSKIPEKGMCKKYFEPKKCTMKKKKKKKT